MKTPKYRFYATLLDAFSWYLKSESEHAERELLDKINRVPETDERAIERMGKGTAFNNLVDFMIDAELSIEDLTATSEYNGMRFEFNGSVVNEIANYLKGATKQYRTSGLIIANGVWVELYGDIDYLLLNKSIDLKTTKEYELGKYKDSMQRHVYPVCLHIEGVTIDEFEFLSTDFTSVFHETYKVDIAESWAILSNHCAMLIDFIEARKHLITDEKIYGRQSVVVV